MIEYRCKCGGDTDTPCMDKAGNPLRLPHVAIQRRIIEWLTDAQGGLCGYCGVDLTAPAAFYTGHEANGYWDMDKPSLDHIIPFTANGEGIARNLQVVHLGCNLWRGKEEGWIISTYADYHARYPRDYDADILDEEKRVADMIRSIYADKKKEDNRRKQYDKRAEIRKESSSKKKALSIEHYEREQYDRGVEWRIRYAERMLVNFKEQAMRDQELTEMGGGKPVDWWVYYRVSIEGYTHVDPQVDHPVPMATTVDTKGRLRYANGTPYARVLVVGRPALCGIGGNKFWVVPQAYALGGSWRERRCYE